MKLRRELNNVILRTCFVANKNNIHELLDYVDMCSNYGINAIDVNGLLCFDKEHLEYKLYSDNGNAEVEKIFEQAKEIANKKNIEIQFPNLKPHIIGCEWTRAIVVNIDGGVSSCPMLSKKHPFYFMDRNTEGKKVSFGNILESDPIEIWNNENYVKFRNSIKNRILPAECKCCAEAHGVVCSNR